MQVLVCIRALNISNVLLSGIAVLSGVFKTSPIDINMLSTTIKKFWCFALDCVQLILKRYIARSNFDIFWK